MTLWSYACGTILLLVSIIRALSCPKGTPARCQRYRWLQAEVANLQANNIPQLVGQEGPSSVDTATHEQLPLPRPANSTEQPARPSSRASDPQQRPRSPQIAFDQVSSGLSRFISQKGRNQFVSHSRHILVFMDLLCLHMSLARACVPRHDCQIAEIYSILQYSSDLFAETRRCIT